MLDVIHQQHVEVIVLFAHIEHVTLLLRTAIKNNVQKVWIGSEAWSLSSELIKENDIRLGTVLGVTLQQMGPLKGLKEFIHRSVSSTPPSSPGSGHTCAGYRRVESSFHSCCFGCEICRAGTYINHTADPNTCQKCQEHEWSGNGSTSCQNRTVVFLRHDAAVSIVLMLAASSTILLCGCVLALFVYHYDTPVVKSAGGKMSLLVLVFLALSSVSVFFFAGRPSAIICSLRIPTFLVFYTATLSCLAVRSFQIVSVFKLAAKLPKAYEFWVKHGGQWLIVAICTIAQVLLSILWVYANGPQPSQRQVIMETALICTWGDQYILFAMFTLVGLLSLASFAFAYMGTDLPKNYNEGKAVTFCLLIFYISWTLFLTLTFIFEENYVDITVANAFCILFSIVGALFGYFGPKCYIILFQPERNTATYFQAAIQTYNLQMR
ncbi:taste receptor type 1 member 1-like [Alosa pseudoharengus]|uniref:taste receptor type 1 member 1-like n=1 Tax=Alosa pseudoharengus TaxID=34774 RepID=UPI003F89BA3A